MTIELQKTSFFERAGNVQKKQNLGSNPRF